MLNIFASVPKGILVDGVPALFQTIIWRLKHFGIECPQNFEMICCLQFRPFFWEASVCCWIFTVVAAWSLGTDFLATHAESRPRFLGRGFQEKPPAMSGKLIYVIAVEKWICCEDIEYLMVALSWRKSLPDSPTHHRQRTRVYHVQNSTCVEGKEHVLRVISCDHRQCFALQVSATPDSQI